MNRKNNSDSNKRENSQRGERPQRRDNTRSENNRFSDNRGKRPYRELQSRDENSRSFDKKESFSRGERPQRRDNTSSENNRFSDNRERRPYRESQLRDENSRSFSKRESSFSKGRDDKERNQNERPFNRTENRSFKKSYDKPFRKRLKPAKISESKDIRLNKFIANSGICSRREADVFISSGNVQVNGNVISEMGYKVKPGDEVRFDGKVIKSEKKEYLLLNKPKGFITTTADEKGRKTVMDLIANATQARLVPVGRLDRPTTGLLLFTNDGDLAKKLTHPSHEVRKIYHVVLDKKLDFSDLKKIEEGLELEDGRIEVDEISYIDKASKNEVGVKIHSGRNRIVRRIFEHLGYQVERLDRVVFSGLTKKDLPRGHWRHLTEQEVINLKNIR